MHPDEIQQRDYNIRTILDRAWRLQRQGHGTPHVIVACALFAAADAMVKIVEEAGFEITGSEAGFSWAPKAVQEVAP